MKKKCKILSLALSFVLLLGLFSAVPASAVNLYFTGINDSVALLTSDTMPFWSGGTLYVPYTVFDANQNGIGVSLGLYASYNRSSNTVTLFNLRQMLMFDLNTGTCWDDISGMTYSSRAIMRNGRPYLALGMVCSFFNLEYSYNQLPYISQGYLVRIKSADVVLDDARFIDAARELLNNRLRDYTQSLSAAETTDPVAPSTPVTPARPSDVEENNTAVYLAFRCENTAGLEEILNVLRNDRHCAVFFLTPRMLEKERDLVRRILGLGHSVGIWAGDEDNVPEQLSRGALALEETACARTTLAYVPSARRVGLEQDGWVCWSETMVLQPGDHVSGSALASSILDRLGTRQSVVYLTLEGGENTARVLHTLLRQLSGKHYTVGIPLETRL